MPVELTRVCWSIGCRCDALIGRQFSGVVRGHRRALRRTGPRPPALCFGVPNQARALRVELAPPVRLGCASPWSTRLASEAAKWRDDQPDASLEVLIPCSARLPRRVFVSGGATSPTIPLRPLACVVRPPSPLACRVRLFVRVSRTFRCGSHARLRLSRPAVAPTHRFDAGCPCGFSLGGDGPVDFARIDAARFGWDAPPFSSCAAASHARRAHHGSCAGAVLLSRRSATRGWGHVAWSGPFSASRSLLGFPSRELGRQRGRPVVTRVTVSLSTPFARRRSWGFPDCPFAGLIPLTGGRRVSARPDPRAVGRTIGRGVLAARSAGPVEALGRLVISGFARPRCKHRR
jgi:hypothetical protein